MRAIYNVSLHSFIGERGDSNDIYSWLFKNGGEDFSYHVVYEGMKCAAYVEITITDPHLAVLFKLAHSERITSELKQ
jgi:hypothetical protein